MPFNQQRFDAFAGRTARRAKRPLTQLDLLKVHVLTDFFHITRRAQQVVGGRFLPWDHGPVVRPAYQRLRNWKMRFDRDGTQPPTLRIVGIEEDRLQFEANGTPDLELFSELELQAMDQAWLVYDSLKLPNSVNHFFHSPTTYFGYAWSQARIENRDIDLIELLEAHERLTDANHTDVKILIG